MNQELVERIMRQTTAPLLVEQLKERIAEEHARRLSFYELSRLKPVFQIMRYIF